MIFAGALITLNGADTATNTTLSSGTLSLGSNSVTLATNFTQVGSSTLAGTGTLKLTNAASLGTTSGGYLEENGSGTTDLQVGGTLGGSSSTPYLALDGGHVLQNDGTFNWVNGYIYLGYDPLAPTVGGGTIVNSAGATFNDEVASSIITETGSTAFDNAGTFATSFASGTTTIGVVFDNSGKVQVGSGGTLDLDGGGNSTGGSFSGGGTLEFGASYTLDAASSITSNVMFSGGTTTIDGTYNAFSTTVNGGTANLLGTIAGLGATNISGVTLNVESLNVTIAAFTQTGSSTLTGTGTLKLTNAVSLGTTSGGYLEENGSGTTDLQAGGTLGGSSSTPYLALDGGHVLQNDGTFNWVNGYIYLGYDPLAPTVGGGTIVNSTGATFNDEVASSIFNETGSNVFDNAGTFTTSFASGTTTIGVVFDNSGTVDVQAGTLQFSGSVTNTGTLAADGGTLYVTNTVSGPGTVVITKDGSADFTAALDQNVTFGSGGGTLILTRPSSFTGEISGISGSSDVLDLGGLNSSPTDTFTTSTSYNSATGTTLLTVTDSTQHTSASVILVGNYTAANGILWTVASDGHGGVDVVDPPAPTATIAAGASLDVQAPSAEMVIFNGGTGLLVLDQPNTFNGHISGFTGTAPDPAHSDTIDLVGVNYNSAQFSETYNASTGLLTVTDGNNSARLTLDKFDGTLNFASDGNGGTLITDPPKTVSAEGTISIAGGSSADAYTERVTQQSAGSFLLEPMKDSNGRASVGCEFSMDNDQITLVKSTQAEIQTRGVAHADGQTAVMNQTVSVSVGGPGNDHFFFQPGFGADTIVNFNPQADTIEMDKFANAQTLSQLASLITTDVHGHAVIELGHSDSITIPGLTQTYLQAHLESLVRLH